MNTVPAGKCTTIAMVNGGEKTHPVVIHDGVVKEWIGFGWIPLRDATAEDIVNHPTVK